MNLNIITALPMLITIVALAGCAGGGRGPGYLFEIIFIVIPLVLIGHYLHKKLESANESLYVVEGQLKRISSRLEALEGKLGVDNNSPKKTTSKKK